MIDKNVVPGYVLERVGGETVQVHYSDLLNVYYSQAKLVGHAESRRQSHRQELQQPMQAQTDRLAGRPGPSLTAAIAAGVWSVRQSGWH